MGIAAAILEHLLAAYMVAVWPLMSRRRYQNLKRRLAQGDSSARPRVYRRMILHQWTMVLVIAVILLLGGASPAELGIRLPADAGWNVELLLILLAAVAGSGLVFRWKGDQFVRRMLEGIKVILPTTGRERWSFVALAVGAGISEELVFRGFLIYYLALYFPRWPLNAQVLATAAVFARMFTKAGAALPARGYWEQHSHCYI